jgi:hypothetical protein
MRLFTVKQVYKGTIELPGPSSVNCRLDRFAKLSTMSPNTHQKLVSSSCLSMPLSQSGPDVNRSTRRTGMGV